jgi:RNA polymerase sigma-70 factor, ECF subfamily
MLRTVHMDVLLPLPLTSFAMAVQETPKNSVMDSKTTRRLRYEALVKDYYHDIYRYACWLTRHLPLAEDLTQETFMRAWRSFDSLQSQASAKAWLFTILRRENARMYEKQRPALEDIDDHEGTLPDATYLEPDQQTEARLLHKAILALEPEYREPLALQVIGGFSGEEIAALLGLNNNTVMTRLFRARNQLRVVLDGSNDGSKDPP